MSRKNIGRPVILLFLLLQALAIITLAIPLTNLVSLLNSSTTPTSSMPLDATISQNATSPSRPLDMFDYHIVGTPLTLRITETGGPFTQNAVNEIIDAAIYKVIMKINTGSGRKKIENGKFDMFAADIEMRIFALANEELTYFLLGKHFCFGGKFLGLNDSPLRVMIILCVFSVPPFLLRMYCMSSVVSENEVLTPQSSQAMSLRGAGST